MVDCPTPFIWQQIGMSCPATSGFVALLLLVLSSPVLPCFTLVYLPSLGVFAFALAMASCHGLSPFPSFAAASCCLGVLSCLLLLHLSCFFLLSWFLHVVASPVVISFVLSCLFSSMLLSSILLTQSCVGSCFCMHVWYFGLHAANGNVLALMELLSSPDLIAPSFGFRLG
ncbi:hypothetical protein U1Q18_030775 [Sarracenia purpurea var. burkii]